MLPAHNGTETSRAAAESMKPHTGRIGQLVFEVIRQHPFDGATCDEVESALRLSHQTVSARIRELADPRIGAIYHHGTRKTKSGRQARVYFITPE